MASKRDYYEVRGVAKGASEEDIKKAYRKMAM
jgi:molecular chaperone DnaJ